MIDLQGMHARAKIRESELRKLLHACDTINTLILKHMPGEVGEREAQELHMMQIRLTTLIRHQHVIDPVVKERKLEGY